MRGSAMLKWSARITSLLLAVLILVIFTGEAASSDFGGFTLRESVMMLAVFVVWTGYLIGWKIQRAGGLMVLGGIAVFYGLNMAFSGRFPGGWIFPIMGIPGALYVLSSLKKPQQG
ncbi:MAG TPA: hypothetical protein PLM22_02345 [Candidatus Sabulitectum sp.]|nr:hypothetical protein [Candidatus Sabulitectum sp.]HPJ27745.1 hypothetical protein [Candidatus Sabulitectum sp.]